MAISGAADGVGSRFKLLPGRLRGLFPGKPRQVLDSLFHQSRYKGQAEDPSSPVLARPQGEFVTRGDLTKESAATLVSSKETASAAARADVLNGPLSNSAPDGVISGTNTGARSRGRSSARVALIRIRRFAREAHLFLLSFVVVVTVVSSGFLLTREILRVSVAIEPISMPAAFSKQGYTPEVAARRLRDAMAKVVRSASSGPRGPSILLRSELPDVVVPTVGLSLSSVASYIRTFMHSGNQTGISGEVTISGQQAWLRLRVNGRVFFSSDPVALDKADDLCQQGALAVLQEIAPYIVAGAAYDNDPKRALELAHTIISKRAAPDETCSGAPD